MRTDATRPRESMHKADAMMLLRISCVKPVEQSHFSTNIELADLEWILAVVRK